MISNDEILTQIEGIDTMDLGMVGDGSFHAFVFDWNEVSMVEVMPANNAITRDGHDIKVTAEADITFRDGGTLSKTLLIHANDEQGVFGLRNISVVQAA